MFEDFHNSLFLKNPNKKAYLSSLQFPGSLGQQTRVIQGPWSDLALLKTLMQLNQDYLYSQEIEGLFESRLTGNLTGTILTLLKIRSEIGSDLIDKILRSSFRHLFQSEDPH